MPPIPTLRYRTGSTAHGIAASLARFLAGSAIHLNPDPAAVDLELFLPDNRQFRNSEAFLRIVLLSPRLHRPARFLSRLPGLHALASGLWWVLNHLPFSSSGEVNTIQREPHSLVRWWFVRGIGLVYAVAFLSLTPQLPGLIGPHGVSPVAERLHDISAPAFFQHPSLLWINPSATFMTTVGWTGFILSLVITAGFLSGPLLLVVGILYLSFVNAAGPFLEYQWDVLLLECGFISLLWTPWRLRDRPTLDSTASFLGLWTLRLLVFRITFFDGLLKYATSDPAWMDLNAVKFQLFTQPLPTPAAWHLAHSSLIFLQAINLGLLAILFITPLLILLSVFTREIAAALLLLLNLWGMISGNASFSGLLNIFLILPLLNDVPLRYAMPSRWFRKRTSASPQSWSIPLFALLLSLAITTSLERFTSRPALPSYVQSVHTWLEPWRIVNAYGGSGTVIRSRTDYVFEGSRDGITWKEYGFPAKPDDPKKPLRWISPAHFHLDWEMAFVSRNNLDLPPWFVRFAGGLHKGTPEILSLLERNPFPDAAPRFVRVRLYSYEPTSLRGRDKTGNWWRRVLVREVSLPPAH